MDPPLPQWIKPKTQPTKDGRVLIWEPQLLHRGPEFSGEHDNEVLVWDGLDKSQIELLVKSQEFWEKDAQKFARTPPNPNFQWVCQIFARVPKANQRNGDRLVVEW